MRAVKASAPHFFMSNKIVSIMEPKYARTVSDAAIMSMVRTVWRILSFGFCGRGVILMIRSFCAFRSSEWSAIFSAISAICADTDFKLLFNSAILDKTD